MDDLRKDIKAAEFFQVIGGDLVASAHMEVIDPAYGAPFQRAPIAAPGELDRAAASARKAQTSWARLDWDARAELLEKYAQLIDEKREWLSTLLTLEQGKPLPKARMELQLTTRFLRILAAVRTPERILLDNETRQVVERWSPKGVVAAIAPWNAPVVLGMVKIATALIGGNTIVIKPSELTPLVTLELGRLGLEIFPPGVLNVVCGDGPLGQAMVAHPGFDKISFTGSTATGRAIAIQAAASLRSVTLELGGNDAAILLPDGSIPALVAAASVTGYNNCGQFCGAVKRIYAPRAMHDEVAEALAVNARALAVGNGFDAGVDIGPIQNLKQYERVCSIVQDAKAAGGQVLAGGAPLSGQGYFFPPTVITGLMDGARLVDEEQFGPVIPIVPYDDLDTVIDTVNAGPYGLTSSIWSRDHERAGALVRRLVVGTGWVNQHGAFDAGIPMPMVKDSGMGTDYGDYGVKGAMNIQIVNTLKSS